VHTTQQLFNDLTTLGIHPGDAILMHSSWKSLGGLEGGPAAFFETFLRLLGPEGTLILPALSYESVDRNQPVFDLLTTPSCVGFLPEYFRTQVPGVVRSMHASHSCCMLGKHAASLAENHELDETPVGPHSPFAKLPELDGWVLMLGCGADCNTSFHGIEETAEPPYLLDRSQRVRYVLRDASGKELEQFALRHNFEINGRHYHQRYSRILPHLTADEVRYGCVLDADCVLMRASAIWKKGHDLLKADPCYFVELPDET